MRCMRVKPRNLNAESPSKNCVSGMAPPAASRLNQPFEFDILLSWLWGGFDGWNQEFWSTSRTKKGHGRRAQRWGRMERRQREASKLSAVLPVLRTGWARLFEADCASASRRADAELGDLAPVQPILGLEARYLLDCDVVSVPRWYLNETIDTLVLNLYCAITPSLSQYIGVFQSNPAYQPKYYASRTVNGTAF